MFSQSTIPTTMRVIDTDSFIQEPKVGVNYLPPMNAFIKTLKTLNEVVHAAIPLPKEFSWEDKINPPSDQGQCGSCWALSATNAVSDRYMIKFKHNNFSLSPLFSMSCISGNVANGQFRTPYLKSCTNACSGGNIADVFELGKSVGLISSSCAPYSNLLDYIKTVQSTGMELEIKLNNYIDSKYPCFNKVTTPSCERNVDQSPCNMDIERGNIFRVPSYDHFGIVESEYKKYESIQNNIKTEIYKNGPVCTSFAVFGDFVFMYAPGIQRKVKEAVSPTNYKSIMTIVNSGVYMQGMLDQFLIDKKTNKPLTPFPDFEKQVPDEFKGQPYGLTFVGGHGVEIVGWGETKIPYKGNMVNIPYWIIKNSWGHNLGRQGIL